MSTPHHDLVLRVMRGDDDRMVRALLGPTVPSHASDIFVACFAGSPQIVGAAAALRPPYPSKPPSSPFHVVVPPPFRRRGIGRALCTHVHSFLKETYGIPALMSWFAVERGDEQELLMSRFQFEKREKLAHYNAQLGPYLSLMTSTVDKLQRSQRIPDAARVVGIHDAPLGPVIDLHLKFIGGQATRLERRLRGEGVRPFHPELSRVCMLDGDVCGFVLCRVNHEQKLVIDSRVVVPRRRRAWTNPLMLHSLGEHATRLGLSVLRFAGAPRHTDTHRIATRFDAPLVRVMDVYVRIR